MPTQAELARARSMFHKVFGSAYGEALMSQLDGSIAEFNAIIMCHISPVIWERDALDIKSKVLCAVAIFAAMNRADVKYFVRAAIHHGATRQEIDEVILLVGLESGFPNATAAAKWVNEAFQEHAEFTKGR